MACNANPSGGCSSAEGQSTTSSGFASHAEGFQTIAAGVGAHAEGSNTYAGGDASHAEGIQTIAQGNLSHAEGALTLASGVSSHAEGNLTVASGFASHAEGEYAIIDGVDKLTMAIGEASHAEGQATTAVGEASHAEGFNTTAGTLENGLGAHSEGFNTTASRQAAHAEGFNTIASGLNSHAEGGSTSASGNNSHAEGSATIASGESAHAQGFQTLASGPVSHSEGILTSTAGFTASHIMGQSGSANESFSWFLANGGIKAKISGNTGVGTFTGGTSLGPADYAELFETVDGLAIEPGYFVTLEGDKIRPAAAEDGYVLGITSAAPAVLGNAGDTEWRGKYQTDEWGRPLTEAVRLEAETDGLGTVTLPARTEIRRLIHPDWDSAKPYIPRSERPEWVAVGLLGQLQVRDDGTCRPGGFCLPGEKGEATAAPSGYRVMRRTGPNRVLVLFR
ncbi:Peptidase_G2, IMC autoproteolytic cleavage domain [Paenibacillus sp. UNCCL117]|uniref:peptidase G2 autoproteolytic cleavage domain-containing protein n=1 Tax=unclassified Paenibacillus TaxID=185978 RepID=UPI000880BAF6|nr:MULTISPECIES: peptidase G2 autoproteolytic cleavage domain-containing protein [unclassified Paenibacillus]SDC53635.1 Peptidase_G2, IMC autoproteolytic cleavage domain [Paenibacillus sp. cl123]SFW11153.1 Peptidase_G2, IMC autoproteolytic cleavage domain [Paenibacillus sp. UNCCL117]